jgi:dipeptidase E
MRLLLISNSTNAGEGYLEYAIPYIRSFIGNQKGKALFIPYAAVSFSFDAYFYKVREKLQGSGLELDSIHTCEDPVNAVQLADFIIIGGGNTFHLLNSLQLNGLIDVIVRRVKQGIPYIGWSAGANVACPTIGTTNDMPVIEPESFKALNLVPFQINPHYLDTHPEGHAGETREARILEYIELNSNRYVIGLREGSILQIEGQKIMLLGGKKIRVFKNGMTALELKAKDDLSFLLD